MPLPLQTRSLYAFTSIALGLMLTTACVPALEDNDVRDDPTTDFDGDGFTEVQGDCDDGDPDATPESVWWTDADEDGYGNPSLNVADCVQPPGTVAGSFVEGLVDFDDADCDDTNALINPGATELCDGLDNNCDSLIDPVGTTGQANFYLDVDQDGFGSGTATVLGCDDAIPSGYVTEKDIDGDGSADFDCDDYQAARFPGNPEVCDGLDNDCDVTTNEDTPGIARDAATWYPDTDDDGYGSGVAVEQCAPPSGHVSNNQDCDDSDSTINPAVLEVCDGIDKNCDGITDDDLKQTYYADSDDDGFGDPTDAQTGCAQPSDTTIDNTDCDDTDETINPSATEVCDSIDNNCDGLIDGSDAADLAPYFPDVDQDGYGDGAAAAEYACKTLPGYVGNASDCDDQRGSVNPTGTESCATAYDDDCDGETNDLNAEGCLEYYVDGDGDGFGGGSSKCRCEAKGSYTETTPGDCDDTDDAIRPNVVETCATAYDDNCDGDTNNLNAIGCTPYYYDTDGDGYGDAANSQCTCDDGGADAWVVDGGDCNDDPAANGLSINPAADELCTQDTATPVDEDCDSLIDEDDALDALTWYEDTDSDGYGDLNAPVIACEQPSDHVSDNTDCDDNRTAVNPAATETCDTAYDDDCDTDTNDQDALSCIDYYIDSDGDTYGDGASQCTCEPSTTYTATIDGDCDEARTSVNPGATETCATAYDDDCDSDDNDEDASGCTDYWEDLDGDGYGTGDAKCTCAATAPFTAAQNGDCDDGTAAINPSAAELCTQGSDTPADENCDTLIDDSSAIDALTWYVDSDEDTYGDAGAPVIACDQPTDAVGDATDCDDGRTAVNPAATETCDTAYDDDCDTDTNDQDALSCTDYFVDSDGDTYGDGAASCTCVATTTHTATQSGDCDDALTDANPGATETCATAYDDDCDSDDNDQDAINCTDYWEDNDGDGYGIGTLTDSRCTCAATAPFTAAQNGDCDDGTAAINPSAAELCTQGSDTPADENCDTLIDDSSAIDALTWYVDSDEDTYGDAGDPVIACDQPTDAVGDATDCDDGRASVNPAAIETCATAYDDDCDTDTNDQDALSCIDYYIDSDGDTYGDGAASCTCVATTTHTATQSGDCDDTLDVVSPAEAETCATAFDDDCSGSDNDLNAINCTDYFSDEDGDGYGYGLLGVDSRCLCQPTGSDSFDATQGDDCQDDPSAGGVSINPGADELCDGDDNDCDGDTDEDDAIDATLFYRDVDGDGYGSDNDTKTACDPPLGYAAPDFDGDGLPDPDCDDGRDTVNPGATETCATGFDDDCDSDTNDEDATGCSDWYYDGDFDAHGIAEAQCLCTPEGSYTAGTYDDCDDANYERYPGNTETCATAFDDDCDLDVNDEGALACTTRYYDEDGDGYGITWSTECRCTALSPFDATQGGDCNDNPAAGGYSQNPGLENCGLVGTISSGDAVAGIVGAYNDFVVGDFNGDGWIDLAIGEPGYDTLYTNPGAVFIFYGPLTGPFKTGSSHNANVVFSPEEYNAQAGLELVAGDFDGDGKDDLVIGGLEKTWRVHGPFAGAMNEGDAVQTLAVVGSLDLWEDPHGGLPAFWVGTAADSGLLCAPPSFSSAGPVPEKLGTGVLDPAGLRQALSKENGGFEISDYSFFPFTYTQLGVGRLHTCALTTGGEAVCWGLDVDGRATPPPNNGLTYTQLDLGLSHTCALTTAGEAVCWGSDVDGQANPPNDGLTYTQLDLGTYHTCALTTAGAAVCWGSDTYGQASPPNNGLTYTQLALGTYHTCALTTAGEAACWGWDSYGQASPPNNGLTYAQLYVGGNYTCALTTAGEAACWGWDSYGQAAPPNNGLTYTQIDPGYYHTCALTTAGAAVCWGDDSYGRASPPNNGLSYTQLEVGNYHTCALTTAGEAVCWGYDGQGQASPPNNGLSYTQLGAGAEHTCALTTAGYAVCWGYDVYGQASPPLDSTLLAWSPDFDMDSATIGEFTGDAYLDIVVGDANLSTSGTDPFSGPYTISNHGKIWVIPGTATGFVGEYDPDTAATHTLTGTTNNFNAGLNLINAGDINGDGVDDLISNQRLYYGPLAVGDTAAESFDAEFPSGDVRPAGDVNDDGYDDLFVGDYLYLGQPN